MKYLFLVLVLVAGTVGVIYVVDNATRPSQQLMAAAPPSPFASSTTTQATQPQQNITISVTPQQPVETPQQPVEPIMPLMVAPAAPVVANGPWFPGKRIIQRIREHRAARASARQAQMQMQMQMQQSCP